MINLRRSAVLLMAASSVGFALSFGKEVVVAYFFGAGREMDAYYAALTLPAFVVNMLASAVAAVLVPAYVTWKVQKPEKAPALARLALRDLPLGLAAVALALSLAAEPLVAVLFPGLSPETAALVVSLERVMAWAAVSMGAASVLTGLLNAEGAFAGPSLSSAIVTLSTLACVAAFWRHGVWALAAGLLVGTALQSAWLSKSWGGADAGPGGRLRWSDPDVQALLPFVGAMAATNGLAEMNGVVDRFMASMLPEGSVASLGYVTKLYAVPQQLLCTPIAAVALPLLAQRVAACDAGALEADFRKACRLGYALLLPATAFLMRFAGPIVVVLFERGEFDPTATRNVARALTCFAVSLPFTVPLSLVSRLAVIGKDAKLLLRFGAAAIGLNAAANLALMRVFTPPVAGIALATSATMLAALAVYVAWLSRAHRWLGARAVLAPALPYLVPTAVMMAAAEAAFRLAPWDASLPKLAAAALAGGAALGLTAHLLKLDEMVRGLAFLSSWKAGA